MRRNGSLTSASKSPTFCPCVHTFLSRDSDYMTVHIPLFRVAKIQYTALLADASNPECYGKASLMASVAMDKEVWNAIGMILYVGDWEHIGSDAHGDSSWRNPNLRSIILHFLQFETN